MRIMTYLECRIAANDGFEYTINLQMNGKDEHHLPVLALESESITITAKTVSIGTFRQMFPSD